MKPAVASLVLVALALLSCHRSEPGSEAKPPPDPIRGHALVISPRELTVHEQVVGTVQPKLQATISAKVLGRLVEMNAIPGKSVENEAVLARIETPQLEAALERAEASRSKAAKEAERFQAVRSSGSGSVSEREIDQALADLRIATAERDLIRSQLDEATVRAPFSGRVIQKHRDTGDLVQPGVPICRLEDPTRLRLELHVAESLAGGFTLGQALPIQLTAIGKDLTGTVSEITPAANTASRTVLVKLDLPSTKGLQAGQFGRALVPRGTKSAMVVPPRALLHRGQLSYVAVLDADDRAQLRIVRPGERRAEGTELLAGLEPGERILSPVPADLISGTPVTVVP